MSDLLYDWFGVLAMQKRERHDPFGKGSREIVTGTGQEFHILIHMSIIWIYVVSCVSGQLAVHGRNLYIGHYMQTVQPKLFIPAMLIATIDIYHFIWLLLILTLLGVTRSAQSKTYWLHFLFI